MPGFGDIALENLLGSPNVQKAAEEFGVSGSGRERSESKTHTWESSGTQVVVEAFDVLNTILEMSSQQLCYYCVMDEPEEALY